MNLLPRRLRRRGALAATVIALVSATAFALTPGDWSHSQTLDVPAPGLVRVDLPAGTLDSARSGLDDLRVLDGAGNEIPYLVERSLPQPALTLRPRTFQSAITQNSTVIMIAPGTSEPIAGLTLETPAPHFVKSVQVEGLRGGGEWEPLQAGEPIFRLSSGASNLEVQFPEGTWDLLRLTIDDRRETPVPFTGALLRTPPSPAPAEPVAVTIKSRDESPGVTRLALDLGAANLPLASLHIETSEPLFTRSVTFSVPQVTDGGIHESMIGESVIYRVDAGGQTGERLDLPVERVINARELLLFIHNQDSPPLAITAVSGQRRVVRLVFLVRNPGRYTLLAGNAQCAAPSYDLSGLGGQLKSAAAMELQPSAITANPGYKEPVVLASLVLNGAAIDVKKWAFREPLPVAQSGVQQIELDPDVLAGSSSDQQDLRIVRDGRQIPFLLGRTSASREVALPANVASDPDKPSLTRWTLKLPKTGLPITRLVCTSPSPLFQRDASLSENIEDERGDKYPHQLGGAAWTQTPDHPAREFAIQLTDAPQSGTLFLEMDNGDNPPIELRDFRGSYPVTRLVFKAAPDAQPLWLYYGNAEAASPRYDLGLVAGELLRASRLSIVPGSEEKIGAVAEPFARALAGRMRYIFWAALAIVTATLLAIISRLLPREK